MKTNKFNLVLLLLCAAVVVSCKKEGALTPTQLTTMSRFEFPEGDSALDEEIYKIAQEKGVKIIYKGWTVSDWNRSWVSPEVSGTVGAWTGRHFQDGTIDTLTRAVNFIRDGILAHLSDEICQSTFYPYIYLVSSYANIGIYPDPYGKQMTSMATAATGMDFCLMCPYVLAADYPDYNNATGLTGYNALIDYDPLERHAVKLLILWNTFFETALNDKGTIEFSDEIMTGLDMVTTLNTTDSSDPDYYRTRGFVDIVEMVGFKSTALPASTYNTFYPSLYATTANSGLLFKHYLLLAMFHDEAAFNAEYGSYPLVMERYNFVVDYMMDNYGIDVKGLAERI